MNELKKCPGCKKLKNKNRFKLYNGNRCLDCRNEYYKKWRIQNPKKTLAIAQKSQRTYNGRKRILWNHILIRLKNDRAYKRIRVTFSFNEFCKWLDLHKRYLFVYNNWIKKGYKLRYTPTVDRIDSSKNYSLDNIQILTHQENSCKNIVINKLIKKQLEKRGLWSSIRKEVELEYNNGLKRINCWCKK